ncbi:hypothetical protein ACE38W_14860 [Chitinophaga sp. Hz27]|uniref:hypothetical protein n=1 Tax=Chitinophaga sp. Hz27 TaxID=3347169 RepID=UPI0035D85C7D
MESRKSENKASVDLKMPELNERVKKVVGHFADGNVSMFVKMLNEVDLGTDISQQKFNRIFNIDSRTNKFPGVPVSVAGAILQRFKTISPEWLYEGKGTMEKEEEYVEFDVAAAVKKTQATTEVMLSAISELLALATGQTATFVREQLQDLVNKRLSE